MKNRRTSEGYKLRIYIDQIKSIKAMSDAEWIEQAVTNHSCGRYITRLEWISYLEKCALEQAGHMLEREAA